ncbi:hypothetical protein EJA72_10100 [Pseudomonas sp. PB120]|nr:hypothetical protein [Pseudomonas sp. PB120]
MVVNDNAYILANRGALWSIASKLAPTEGRTRSAPTKKPRTSRGFSFSALNQASIPQPIIRKC